MSKYGKVVGEALIRVSPTTELFHNKLSKEVEKLNKKKKPQIDIPLVVDSEEAERELKKFGELADVLDGRILKVKVELDDAEARAAINRLIRDTEDRSFTIDGKMNVNDDSLKEANKKLNNFREENNMMDVWAVTRTEGAERSMNEFRKRFEEMVITPKITPEYGPGKKRNPIVDEEWNSINMIPKLYSKMHAQFEKGIRQVYDPYLKTLGKFYNATAQPFRNFRKMANEAETAAQFFDKLSDSIIDFDSKLKKNLAPAAQIFRRMGDEAAKVSVPIKFLGSGMKAASAKFRDAAKGFSNDNKKIWTPTFKSMRLSISGLSSAWDSVAEKANKSTEGMFRNFSARAKRAGSEASSSILDLFRNVGRGVSLDLSGTLDGLTKKFSKLPKLNFGNAFRGVGRDISETVEGLGELVPYLGDTEEGINRASRAWGRFRSSAESSISGVARALRKFSSSVWGDFANKTLSSMGDKLLGVVSEVDSRARRMRGLFKLQLGFITEDIAAFTEGHKRTFRAIFDSLGKDVKDFSEGSRKYFKDMWVAFNIGLVLAQIDAKSALGKMKRRFAGFGFDVSGIFSRLKEHMGRDIYDFAPKAIEASKSAQLAITEFARSASTDLAIISGSSKRGRFSGMFDGLKESVDGAFGGLRGYLQDGLNRLREYYPDLTRLRDRLSAVTDAMRHLGSQASEIFGGMSINVKGLTGSFRGFRLTAGGAFDGISEKVSGIGSSFRNLSGQAGDAFTGAFDRIKGISGGKSNDILKGMTIPFERFGFNASDKFRKGVGQPFGDFFKRSSPVISQGFGKMGAQFQKGAGKIRGVFGKSVAGMGGLLSKGLNKAMNSKKLWSGVTKGMTRFSDIAMGGARIAIGAFTILGSTIMKSVVPALGAAAIGIGLVAGKVAIAGVLALAGAIYSVAQGAVLMAPALAAAAGISFMALKFGLEGVKDAVGQALSAETAEEFEEAMSGVPASVQGVARALRDFKPAIDEMKRATQDNLLADLGPSLSSAVGNLLPTLSQGLQSVANEWNGALKLAMAELASPEAASGLQAITEGTTAMAREMQPTLAALIGGMGQLAEAGAQYLEPLGKWINDSAEGFREWAAEFTKIDEATGLSRFQVVIQDAIRNAGYLGDIFGGMFGAIGNILTASQRGGGGMLASMGGGMRKLQEYTAEGSEGFDKIVGFMQEASDLAELLGDLLSPVMSIILDLTTALASVGVGAMPGITKFAEGLAGGLAPVTAIAETFGADLGSGVESLSGFAGSLGGTLAPLLGGLGGGLSSALKGAGAGLDVVSEPLRNAATAMQPVLEKVGSALGKIFESAGPVIAGSLDMIAAMAPVLGEVATQIGDVASALLDAIGPIFEENDDFLISLAENAKALVVILGENLVSTINFLAPIVQWLAAAFYGVMEAMTPFLPIIASIGSVVVILGTGIALLAKAFGPLVTIIKTARTVWSLLSLAFSMSPIGMLILAIAGLATGLYLFFTKTETGRKMWKTMTDAVADGWDWLVDKLKSGWDWVVDKVFNPMREWASGIQDDFKNMVEGIKDKFESLKKIFADPIEHLINPIWNNTMVPLSEKIHSVIPAIPVFERAGMAFAQGGVLPGYSPGVDNYHFVNPSTGQNLHLSGGEAVMRPEWTRAVGGPAAVEEMNRRAIRGDLKPTKHHKHADGGTLAFAGGGIIGSMIDIVSRKYPQLQMTSGQRPGGGLHGAGMATDWSNGGGNTPAQLALAQDIAQTYPGSAELIYDAPGWSGNIKNGANVGAFGEFYTMAQAGRHDHHVHWGMNTPPTMPFGGGVFEGGSDGSGGGQSLWERAKAFAAKIWDQVTGFFSNSWSKVTSGFGNLGGGFLGDMVKGYATSAFDGLKAQAKKLIPNLSGGGESVDVSDITGPVVDQVKQVFERHGFTGAEWDAAKWIIQQESSWSPTAVNPSSGAFGLFQFNPMGGDTLGQYLPSRSTDPAIQADAGARYMRNRYGTPTAAKAFWEANQWYDQGGEARGIGVMQKNVLSPERVLSPAQTKAFNDFVYDFMPALIETWRKNPMEIRNGLAAVRGEIKRSAKLIAEEREVKISGMTRAAKSMFVAEIEGTKELNKVDTATLMKLDPRDHKSIRSWVDANGKTLETNLTGAARMVAQIAPDPKAYLEAEKRAKEAIDKDREEAREKAKEEAKEKSQEAKEKEREAKREKEKAEDEAAKTDEEKEALKEARKAAEKAESKAEQERSAIEQEAERKEDERIEALKATGEYYYGYKTFGDQGENPNAREVPEHERVAQDTMKNIAGRVGLGGVADKAFSIYRMVESIGQSVETAIPSWLAAANGDYAGLNHNVAVSSSLALDSAQQEATALIPTLAGDVFEALVARNTQAPMYGSFIENVYTGMSKGEFNQAIEEYQARSARKGTGTNRPR